ncbi:nucleolin 2-like [Daucus carota subsp. sativus]|uniref:nucleolin 2-like n=1 Tax=Daucus carota subsp. sativus TaxID=79200 RepID=UPI003082E8BC
MDMLQIGYSLIYSTNFDFGRLVITNIGERMHENRQIIYFSRFRQLLFKATVGEVALDAADGIKPFKLHKRVFKDLISKDEKRPVLRPLQIPAPLRARLQAPQQQPQPQPHHPKRRRLVAAYDYEDLEAPPATNSEPSQASPKTKTTRFKRRANKPKRAKVPITEITDFTVEEEQAPSTTIPDLSQALMVHPLQVVPISATTASSTSSEVDEEIICKEQAEAETTVSDSQIPISDHGPSTPIPHSPLKFPEGAIIHDTAPENYKSDAVVEESDKVALEALQSLAKAGEEPSKSKSEVQEKSVPDPVENVEDPASDDDEDDDSSDDENDDESQNRGSQFQGNSKYGQEKALVTSKGRHEEAGVCQSISGTENVHH